MEGAVRTAYCHRGFQGSGNRFIRCQSDGHWSPVEAQCDGIKQPTFCGPLPTIPNVFLWTDSYSVGSQAVVVCLDQPEQEYHETISCLPNGQWSLIRNGCRQQRLPDRCGVMPTIPNGMIWGESNSIGSKGFIVCMNGFERHGQESIQCQQSGEWSSVNAECKRAHVVSCGPLPHLENGYISTNSFTVSSQAFTICNEGYDRQGKLSITCQTSGQWTPLETSCHSQQCLESPPDVPNGWVTRGANTIGTKRLIQCNFGFQRQGPEFIECNSSGQWSALLTTCALSKQITHYHTNY